jgi:class 3 adenylate cyclase
MPLSLLRRLSIQSKLIFMMLAVTNTAIVVISYLAYRSGIEALNEATLHQLTSVRATKAHQIETQIERIRNQVTHLSEDPMYIVFTKELREGYNKLRDVDLKEGMDAKVRQYYAEDYLAALAKNTSTTPVLENYLPEASVSLYLQYYYIANNQHPTGQKYMLDAPAGDPSEFSAVHRKYHPLVRRFVIAFGYENLCLIDSDTGDVLYTVGKTPLFATNAYTGPYATTQAGLVLKSLRRSKDKGAIKEAPFESFAPSLGKPVGFIASPIFDGPTQIGILGVQFPTDEINRVMTGNLGWERDGLGKTGEVYLVGEDYTFRSMSRFLFEDPDSYYKALREGAHSTEEIERIRRLGTPILAQTVHTSAVEAALAGKTTTAVIEDYRGVRTLTSCAPLNMPGLRWVIVAQIDANEAFAPLNQLTRQILYTSVIMIFVVTILASIMSHVFVRPIYQLIEGVRQLESGKTDVVVNLDSKDEFQELGSAFNAMSRSLAAKSELLNQKIRENEDLLLNILPGPAAARMREGDQQVSETFPDITVLFANLSGYTELAETLAADEAVGLLNDLIGAIDETAERHGVEKIKTTGLSYMAVSGMSVQCLDHASRMLAFAEELPRIVHRFNKDRGIHLSMQIGLHSGPVVGGIVGRTKFIYDLWGATVNNARAILSEGQTDTILVTDPVHARTLDLAAYGPAVNLKLAGGKTIRVWPITGSGFAGSSELEKDTVCSTT